MKKFISVFFSGTAHTLTSNYLAGYLYQKTFADKNTHFKGGYTGCGVAYGINGSLFGSGLDEQCDRIISHISQLIAEGHEVVLNVYGHSRGGLAAIMLAQQLSLVSPQKLEINLALMDPVPGNLIASANLDPFDTTLANKGMDLTSCAPLNNVLAIYPYEPLPDFIFHAPLFVSYPLHVQPEVIVVPGCHAEAEKTTSAETAITASLVMSFLSENGTKLACPKISQGQILAAYDEAMKNLNRYGPQERDAHSAKGIYIAAQTGADYFNEHHRKLANGESNTSLAVSLKKSNNPFSLMKRTAAGRIFMGVLKWALLGVGLAVILYFTGGLAAIPFLAPAIASMGALSILAAAPVIASGLALLWHGLVKPMVSPLLHRFLYPKYSLRDNINPPEPSESKESLSNSSESEKSSTETYDKMTESLYQSGITREELLSNPAVKEMLTTEWAYKSVLDTLAKTLRKSELVGDNAVLRALGTLVGNLWLVSFQLLENTRKGIHEKNTTEGRNQLRIQRGEILERFFKILSVYAGLYQKCMDEQRDNPKAFEALNEFLKAQVYEDGRRGLDLGAHLIAPIQRGPKYKLLIQEVHKLGTNLDQQNVAECKEKLDFIDNKLNEVNKSLETTPSKTSAPKNDGCWPFWSSEKPVKRAEPTTANHFSKPF